MFNEPSDVHQILTSTVSVEKGCNNKMVTVKNIYLGLFLQICLSFWTQKVQYLKANRNIQRTYINNDLE